MNELITISCRKNDSSELDKFPRALMTPTEIKVVDFISGFKERHGVLPSTEEIVRAIPVFIDFFLDEVEMPLSFYGEKALEGRVAELVASAGEKLANASLSGELDEVYKLSKEIEELQAFTLVREKPLNLKEELAKPDEPIEYIAGRIFAKESVHFVYGDSETKKTWVMTHLLLSIASGLPDWLNFPIKQTGPVLFLDEEMGDKRVKSRLKKIINGFRLDGKITNAGNFNYFSGKGFSLGKEDDVRKIISYVKETGSIALLLDAWADFIPDLEENSSADMSMAMRQLRRIANETGVCVIMVHHKTKGTNDYRGSTAIRALCDVMIEVISEPQSLTVEFNPKKTRDGYFLGFSARIDATPPDEEVEEPFFRLFPIEFKPTTHVLPIKRGERRAQIILEFLGEDKEWHSVQEIYNAVNGTVKVSDSAIRRTLDELTGKGKILSTDDGKKAVYCIKPEIKEGE